MSCEKGISMNLAYFLLPKTRVAYLYDDFTFRQGLEKMRCHGYTAIPVITRRGQYAGTVSEGDFLWRLLDERDGEREVIPSMRELEKWKVRDILRVENFPPVRITATLEELMMFAMNQNFVPVVDDMDHFAGIVTRHDIIRYFAMELRGVRCTPQKQEQNSAFLLQ